MVAPKCYFDNALNRSSGALSDVIDRLSLCPNMEGG